MPKTKHFNGKKYTKVTDSLSKRYALSVTKRLRKQGKNARISPKLLPISAHSRKRGFKDRMYEIYTRPRTRKRKRRKR